MILTLEEAKKWLRVDYDEDNMQISLLISNAEAYLKDAVDDFELKVCNDSDDRFKNKARIVMLVLITNWYDNRDFTELEVDEKVRYTISSLIQQMKHSYTGNKNE